MIKYFQHPKWFVISEWNLIKWNLGWKWKFYLLLHHVRERTWPSGFMEYQMPLQFWGAGGFEVPWSSGKDGSPGAVRLQGAGWPRIPAGCAPRASRCLSQALKALLFQTWRPESSVKESSFLLWCLRTMTSRLTSLDQYLHFSLLLYSTAKNACYSLVQRSWK